MSGTELARQDNTLPAVTDAGFLEEVRVQLAPKATDAELRHFAFVVQKTQLDPWSRQVYLIGRWDGRAKREVHRPQTSIDGLRLIAERTGKYEGQTPVEWCGDDGVWKDVWLSKDKPRAARVGIYKTGRVVPTYAVALWDEYAVTGKNGQLIGLWPSKPALMLAKCCEALGLRKVFPQETSGLYIAEEMGRADVEATAEEIGPDEVLTPTAIEPPAPEVPADWTAPDDVIVQFFDLAKEAGYCEAAEKGGDIFHTLRLQIALEGVSTEGELTDVLRSLTRAQFEALWLRLLEEKGDREAERKAKAAES